jgi:hypothetical protein
MEEVLIADDEEPTAEQLEKITEREAAEARELRTLHLLWDVQRYFGGKYRIIPFDEDDDESPRIELRVADHSGNARNMNDMCEYHISVVIADDDPTGCRFYNPDQNMPNELHFSGDNTVTEIVSAIENRIKEIKNKHHES